MVIYSILLSDTNVTWVFRIVNVHKTIKQVITIRKDLHDLCDILV